MSARIRISGALALAAFCALPATATARSRGPCASAASVPAKPASSTSRAAVACLVNAYRREHHRSPLRVDPRLTRAAQRYSAAMSTRRFFSHTAPGGGTLVDRIRATGYLSRADVWRVGENLGWATPGLASPEPVFEAWTRSPTHRANLLRAVYREVGIGIAPGTPSGQPGATYVLHLGVRDPGGTRDPQAD